jgi:hypothetical protein
MNELPAPTSSPPLPELHKTLRWVLDKAGLALAPAAGYYLVFRYETGYCAAFGIPNSLIRPDLTTVLIVASAFLAFGWFICVVIDSFLDLAMQPQTEHPWRRGFRLYSPVVSI